MLFMPYGKHAALPDATSRHFASDQCSQQLWVCLSRMCTMLARRLPLILCSRTETSLASCQLSEWKHYTGMTTLQAQNVPGSVAVQGDVPRRLDSPDCHTCGSSLCRHMAHADLSGKTFPLLQCSIVVANVVRSQFLDWDHHARKLPIACASYKCITMITCILNDRELSLSEHLSETGAMTCHAADCTAFCSS